MEYLKELKTEKLDIEDMNILIHYCEDVTPNLLTESNLKGSKLVGAYSVIKHQPHNPTGKYHCHIYNKGNEIFAINKDSTAHDGFHGVSMPKKVVDTLKLKYPDWVFPNNRIIENKSIVFYNSLNDFIEDTVRKILNEYFNKNK
jgi:hypothetical protein